MGALPEVEEAEHRLGLFALAQVRIGVAERAGIGILGEEDEDARLAAAAFGDVVALDARVRSVVGHGVEVEAERTGGEQRLVAEHRAVPGAEQGAGVFGGDARGVLAEIALLRDAVECAEQPQPLIGDERHHVALALDGPELEREAGAQRVGAGTHLRAGQPGGVGHLLQPQAHQVGQEQEQSPAARCEPPRGEAEGARVGHRLHGGAWQLGALLIKAPGQRGEAELAQHLADGGGAERRALLRTDVGRMGWWRVEGRRVNQSDENTSSDNLRHEPDSVTPPTAAPTLKGRRRTANRPQIQSSHDAPAPPCRPGAPKTPMIQ